MYICCVEESKMKAFNNGILSRLKIFFSYLEPVSSFEAGMFI